MRVSWRKNQKFSLWGSSFLCRIWNIYQRAPIQRNLPCPEKLLVVYLEWYFYEDKPNLTWWHGCNTLLTKCYIFCQFLFFKNLLFFDITYQYKTKACLKKISLMSSVISHRTYHETIVCLLTLRGNPTDGLGSRLLKSKSTQVKVRVASLRGSKGNNCFCSYLPVWKFI